MINLPQNQKRTALSTSTTTQLAQRLRVYGHPIRLRILDFLATSHGPQRVTEITRASEGVGQAIISQQLKILRENGILVAERQGASVYYSLTSPKEWELLLYLREYGTALAITPDLDQDDEDSD